MKQSVLAVVFNNQRDQILLIKRRDVEVWVLPGGGVDQEERPEDAAVREVLEETGLHVAVTKKTGEYTPLNKITKLTHLYECKVLEGKISKTEETRDIGFFNLSELPKTFLHVHKDWVEDAVRNEPNVIKKPISQVTYWKLFKYFLRHPIQVIRALFARLGIPINSK